MKPTEHKENFVVNLALKEKEREKPSVCIYINISLDISLT
jgi:hypothetical protein